MSDPGMAGTTVTVGGRETDPAVAAKLVDLQVDLQLRMPDRLALRYRDFDLTLVDGETFSIGSSVAVTLDSAEAIDSATVFDGQIVGLEPEFTEEGAILAVNALDRGHALQRESRTATYQDMSYGEIAASLAEQAGLEPGSISSGLTLPFVQQSNETDWDFLWRLALEVDYEVKVEGRALRFSPAGRFTEGVTTLEWGKALLAFRPRVSGVQQVEEVTVRGWDPVAAVAIEATASAPAAENRLGVDRDEVVSAMGTGGATLVDHPVTSQAHADALASSLAARLASVFVEGEGYARGTPELVAGGQVRIAGVGETFSGTYALTGVRHRYRLRTGYRTEFSICGRAHRTVLGLTRAPARPGWRHRVVVGVVTNTQDPDKLGRVRVKYPALDESHEGWWARVVAPGSGTTRGFFALPQVGDEVLIVFQHASDQHPYLLGTVFNGQAKPGTVVQPDGSFTLATPQRVTIASAQRAEVTTGSDLVLAAGGAIAVSTQEGEKDAPAADAEGEEPGEGEGAGGAAGEGAPGPGDIQLSALAGLTLKAEGATSLSAGTTGRVSATEGLTVSGGEQLTLGADGSVRISGASISIVGEETVTITAPEIALGP